MHTHSHAHTQSHTHTQTHTRAHTFSHTHSHTEHTEERNCSLAGSGLGWGYHGELNEKSFPLLMKILARVGETEHSPVGHRSHHDMAATTTPQPRGLGDQPTAAPQPDKCAPGTPGSPALGVLSRTPLRPHVKHGAVLTARGRARRNHLERPSPSVPEGCSRAVLQAALQLRGPGRMATSGPVPAARFESFTQSHPGAAPKHSPSKAFPVLRSPACRRPSVSLLAISPHACGSPAKPALQPLPLNSAGT